MGHTNSAGPGTPGAGGAGGKGGQPFRHSYLPNTEGDRRAMLEAIGITSVDELFEDIPDEVRFKGEMDLAPPMSEMELLTHMEAMASANAHVGEYTCFLGAGMYDHYVPSVVDKIISRGEFFTSYTPYQAEVSQGNLQAIYEFQTMICQLTGMDVANASMYDGPTAAAEACLVAVNQTRRETILVSGTVHPQYREVIGTYSTTQGLTVADVAVDEGATDGAALDEMLGSDAACLVIQVPNFFGIVEDARELTRKAAEAGAMVIVIADPVSLGAVEAPGAYGADIAVGEGQALGNPLSYGGPQFGFLAARDKLIRRMPGRIVGATVDADGRRGYVLTLQTREQHIRRERATSNICTNQALMALAATVYMTAVGREGLRGVADLCLQKSHYLAEGIGRLERFRLAFPHRPFFKEMVVRTDLPVDDVLAELRQHKILGGVPLGRYYPDMDDCFLVAVTEKRTREEIDYFIGRLEAIV